MIKKTLVYPEESIERKKLFEDIGYKNRSEFACNVCKYCIRMHCIDGDYDTCKPQIIEHVINTHPSYCYLCSKCNELFIFKKDFKSHKC